MSDAADNKTLYYVCPKCGSADLEQGRGFARFTCQSCRYDGERSEFPISSGG